jgi:phospholipid transport system substrate-binding protein
VILRPSTFSGAALALASLAVASGLFLPRTRTVAAADVSPQQAGPQELVAVLSTRLFAALDRDRAAFRHDPDLVVRFVDQLLSPHFDTEYMARLVLGAQWRIVAPEDRQRFALALYHSLLRTHARAVSEWTSDRVRFLPFTGDAAALQAIVRTQVARPGSAVASVDYHLHKTAEGWKVFDVIVDGVSYVRNYHEDINTEVSQTGLESVIARLEKRNTGATAHPARTAPNPGGDSD